MRVLIYFLAVCALSVVHQSIAQEYSQEALKAQITEASQQLEENQQLSSKDKAALSKRLDHAKSLIQEANDNNELINRYEDAVSNASATVAKLNQQVGEVADKSIPAIKQGSEDNLANELVVAEADQESLMAELSALQQQQTSLSARPNQIADELVVAREAVGNATESLQKLPEDKTDLTERAQLLEQKANILNLETTITNLEREVATIPARQSLTEAKLNVTRAKITQSETTIAAIQGYLDESRQGQASTAIASSRKALASAKEYPALSTIGEENLSLAKQLKELIAEGPGADENSAKLRSQVVDLQQSAETVERVLATGSVTDELGILLRQLQSGLPRLSPLEKRRSHIEELLVRQQLNLILWQDRLRNLADTAAATRRLLQQNSADNQVIGDNALRLGQELVTSRKALLKELIESSIAHIDRLTEEKLVITDVMAKTSEIKSLLDRRLVWLPSNAGLADNVWHNLVTSGQWFLSPTSWLQVLQDLWRGIQQSILMTLVFVLIPIAIWAIRPMIKRSLGRLVAQVGKVEQDTYWTTPLALIATIALALPLPIIIGTAAGLITVGSAADSFSRSIATGLAAVSSLSLILLFFRSMCRKNGIFAEHFGWSDVAREKLRRLLLWFVWVQCLGSFLFAASISNGLMELRYGLAAFSFVAVSVGIALFCYSFFKPNGGIASSIVGDTPATTLTLIAFPVLVAAPLLIGFLPLFGFFDTAVALQSKLFESGIVLILTAILYGILMRVFLVAYRRFLLRRKLRRRAEQQEKRKSSSEAEASGDAVPGHRPEKESDPDEVSRQTSAILMWLSGAIFLVGLWFIWKPLLPALGIVDDITLWQKVTVVEGIETTSGVTLWNIILSVGFIIGGFIAAKNMRGLMEVGFFERFKLDAGARYAAVTVMGYVVIGLGIVIGLGQLGINWSKLQWIVAALGVGLGFGLQEIVANFVSGLIILFERPIRVGDTVTIGNLSGTVSNIKIRATTVTDFDNREVLLPNKSIITENVTNWTLNDAVTRVVLTVGVAYGSDINNVRHLLLQAAESHVDVLKVPPPNVFFMNHGNSSLDFEIRVFVAAPAKRLPVTHDINQLINQALRDNGIGIPFPQRDVHLIGSKEPKEREEQD